MRNDMSTTKKSVLEVVEYMNLARWQNYHVPNSQRVTLDPNNLQRFLLFASLELGTLLWAQLIGPVVHHPSLLHAHPRVVGMA